MLHDRRLYDGPMRPDLVTIETPDHIEFHYHLAGIGSRVAAAAIDLLLQSLLLLVLAILLIVVAAWQPGETAKDYASGWGLAFVILGVFLTLWAYPILFELFMDGRTPGKLRMRIRVISANGTALTPTAVFVRNLLRVADFFPAFYFLGGCVLVASRRGQRLGDLAAGTIVIDEAPHEADPPAPPIELQAGTQHDLALLAALRQHGAHRLAPEELQLIESFLARLPQLSPDARVSLARQLADRFAARLGVAAPDAQWFLLHVRLAAHQPVAAGQERTP